MMNVRQVELTKPRADRIVCVSNTDPLLAGLNDLGHGAPGSARLVAGCVLRRAAETRTAGPSCLCPSIPTEPTDPALGAALLAQEVADRTGAIEGLARVSGQAVEQVRRAKAELIDKLEAQQKRLLGLHGARQRRRADRALRHPAGEVPGAQAQAGCLAAQLRKRRRRPTRAVFWSCLELRQTGGGGGIRTLVGGVPRNSFQDCRIQPLCHPSRCR